MEVENNTDKYKTWPQIYPTISGSMAIVCSGCALGWTSPAMSSLSSADSGLGLDYDQVSWLASVVHFGAMAGPLVTLHLIDRIGRKWTILVALLFHAIGWLVMLISPTFTQLMIARSLLGIGNGMSLSTCPLYVGEISENKKRGALQMISASGSPLGILYVSIIGPRTTLLGLNICGVLVPVISAFAFMWAPESPYYYEKNGRRDRALKTLMRLRGVKEEETVREEMESITQYLERNKGLGFLDTLKEMSTRNNMKAVSLMLVINFGTQFAGMFAISSYTEKIFRDADSPIDPPDAVVLLAFVTLLFSLLSSTIVDRVGRKMLLLVSYVAICACNILTGSYLLLSQKEIVDTNYAWMAMLGVFGFQMAASIGLNPVPSVLLGEVFPAPTRSWCICFVISYGMGLAFVVTKLFQVIDSTIGGFFAFYLFSFCIMLAFTYVCILMPETKGMSFNEIQETLKDKIHIKSLNK